MTQFQPKHSQALYNFLVEKGLEDVRNDLPFDQRQQNERMRQAQNNQGGYDYVVLFFRDCLNDMQLIAKYEVSLDPTTFKQERLNAIEHFEENFTETNYMLCHE